MSPYTTGLHTGNPAPFLYTPTSLLPEHSVLTDVQQATGKNGHQWITCRSGGQGTRPEIWMGSEFVVNSSTANSAIIWLSTQHPNGLYHCLSAQSQKEYFSLFFNNSGTYSTKHMEYVLYCMSTYWYVGRHFIRINLYKIVAYIIQLYLLTYIILPSPYSHSTNTNCPEQ